MADNNHSTLRSLFSDIANSIRGKTEWNNTIIADTFPEAIDKINWDATISSSSQLMNGVIAYGNNGKFVGNIQTKTENDLVIDGPNVTVPAGYYGNNATANVGVGNVVSNFNVQTGNFEVNISNGYVNSAVYNNSIGLSNPSVSSNIIINGPTVTGYVSGNAGYTNAFNISVSGNVNSGTINAKITNHSVASPTINVTYDGNIGTTVQPSGNYYKISFNSTVTNGSSKTRAAANVLTNGYVNPSNDVNSTWSNKAVTANVTLPNTYYVNKGNMSTGNISGEAYLETTNDYGFRVNVSIPEGYYDGTQTVVKNFTTGIFPAPNSKATSNKMLVGYSLYDEDGRLVTGNMPNIVGDNNTITTQGGTYSIAEGYHDGSGVVTALFPDAFRTPGNGVANVTVPENGTVIWAGNNWVYMRGNINYTLAPVDNSYVINIRGNGRVDTGEGYITSGWAYSNNAYQNIYIRKGSVSIDDNYWYAEKPGFWVDYNNGIVSALGETSYYQVKPNIKEGYVYNNVANNWINVTYNSNNLQLNVIRDDNNGYLYNRTITPGIDSQIIANKGDFVVANHITVEGMGSAVVRLNTSVSDEHPITTPTISFNNTDNKYHVTGIGSVNVDSFINVARNGYVDTNSNNSKSTMGLVNLNFSLNKVTVVTNFNAGLVKPVITYVPISSNINAADGNIYYINNGNYPTSGAWVVVNTNEITSTGTANVSGIVYGFSDGVNYNAINSSGNYGASSSDDALIRIREGNISTNTTVNNNRVETFVNISNGWLKDRTIIVDSNIASGTLNALNTSHGAISYGLKYPNSSVNTSDKLTLSSGDPTSMGRNAYMINVYGNGGGLITSSGYLENGTVKYSNKQKYYYINSSDNISTTTNTNVNGSVFTYNVSSTINEGYTKGETVWSNGTLSINTTSRVANSGNVNISTPNQGIAVWVNNTWAYMSGNIPYSSYPQNMSYVINVSGNGTVDTGEGYVDSGWTTSNTSYKNIYINIASVGLDNNTINASPLSMNVDNNTGKVYSYGDGIVIGTASIKPNVDRNGFVNVNSVYPGRINVYGATSNYSLPTKGTNGSNVYVNASASTSVIAMNKGEFLIADHIIVNRLTNGTIDVPSGSAQQNTPTVMVDFNNGIINAIVQAKKGTAYRNITNAGYFDVNNAPGNFQMTESYRAINVGVSTLNSIQSYISEGLVVNVNSGEVNASDKVNITNTSPDWNNTYYRVNLASIVQHSSGLTSGGFNNAFLNVYIPKGALWADSYHSGGNDGVVTINNSSGKVYRNNVLVNVPVNVYGGYLQDGTVFIDGIRDFNFQLNTKAGSTTEITNTSTITLINAGQFATGAIKAYAAPGELKHNETIDGNNKAALDAGYVYSTTALNVNGTNVFRLRSNPANGNICINGFYPVKTNGFATTSMGMNFNLNNAWGEMLVNGIKVTTTVSGTISRSPVLRYGGVPNGTVNAAGGDITTTVPTSGPYITVNTPVNTATATATISSVTGGYTDGTVYEKTQGTKAGGAAAMANRYIPIKEGTVNTSSTSVTISNGWLNDQTININTIANSATLTATGSNSKSGKTVTYNVNATVSEGYTAGETKWVNGSVSVNTGALSKTAASATATSSGLVINTGNGAVNASDKISFVSAANNTTYKITASGSGGANVTTAGWLDAGTSNSNSTTNAYYIAKSNGTNLSKSPYTNGTAQTATISAGYLPSAVTITWNGVASGVLGKDAASVTSDGLYNSSNSGVNASDKVAITSTATNGYYRITGKGGAKVTTAGYIAKDVANNNSASIYVAKSNGTNLSKSPYTNGTAQTATISAGYLPSAITITWNGVASATRSASLNGLTSIGLVTNAGNGAVNSSDKAAQVTTTKTNNYYQLNVNAVSTTTAGYVSAGSTGNYTPYVYIKKGSATTPATTVTIGAPTLTLNKTTGIVSSTAPTNTAEVTPTIVEGYVKAGTKGTITAQSTAGSVNVGLGSTAVKKNALSVNATGLVTYKFNAAVTAGYQDASTKWNNGTWQLDYATLGNNTGFPYTEIYCEGRITNDSNGAIDTSDRITDASLVPVNNYYKINSTAQWNQTYVAGWLNAGGILSSWETPMYIKKGSIATGSASVLNNSNGNVRYYRNVSAGYIKSDSTTASYLQLNTKAGGTTYIEGQTKLINAGQFATGDIYAAVNAGDRSAFMQTFTSAGLVTNASNNAVNASDAMSVTTTATNNYYRVNINVRAYTTKGWLAEGNAYNNNPAIYVQKGNTVSTSVTPYTNGVARVVGVNKGYYPSTVEITVNGVAAGTLAAGSASVLNNSNGNIRYYRNVSAAGYLATNTTPYYLQLNTKAGATYTNITTTAVTVINAGQFAVGAIKVSAPAGTLAAGSASVLNNSNGNIRYYRNVSAAGYIAANTTAYYLQLNTKAGGTFNVNSTGSTLINAGQFATGAIIAKAILDNCTYDSNNTRLIIPTGLIIPA